MLEVHPSPSSSERPPEHRPPLRATPAEQVGFWLARSRRHGVPFDAAWEAALRRVRWPHGRELREEWQDVIEWSKPAYLAAYEWAPGADIHMRHLRSDNVTGTITATIVHHAA